MEQYFCVRLSLEPVPRGLQFYAQFDEVKDFSIEGQPIAPLIIAHGLTASGQIDD